MVRNRSIAAGFLLVVLVSCFLLGQNAQPQSVADALSKIRDEGIARSQVMPITSYITDVSGPRLTNSPNIKASAQWVIGKMKEWGISNPHLETWGPFGRGWSSERFYAV